MDSHLCLNYPKADDFFIEEDLLSLQVLCGNEFALVV